jgi:hypothetical protein
MKRVPQGHSLFAIAVLLDPTNSFTMVVVFFTLDV